MSKLDITDNLIEAIKASNNKFEIQTDAAGREYTQVPFVLLPEAKIIKREKLPPIDVSTLDALIEYVKSDLDSGSNGGRKLMIHVQSHDLVTLTTDVYGPDRARDTYMVAKWSNLFTSGFKFDSYQQQESFVIGLKTLFEQSDEPDAGINKVVKLSANITEVAEVNRVDDGANQTIVAKTGVARTENVTAENPYELRPYRTFRDITQPASLFMWRAKSNDQLALFEADAQSWKHEAIRSIREYLDSAINEDSNGEKRAVRIPILG